MKKYTYFIIIILLIGIICISATACIHQKEIDTEEVLDTHTVVMDTEELFNYYFSVNITN